MSSPIFPSNTTMRGMHSKHHRLRGVSSLLMGGTGPPRDDDEKTGTSWEKWSGDSRWQVWLSMILAGALACASFSGRNYPIQRLLGMFHIERKTIWVIPQWRIYIYIPLLYMTIPRYPCLSSGLLLVIGSRTPHAGKSCAKGGTAQLWAGSSTPLCNYDLYQFLSQHKS